MPSPVEAARWRSSPAAAPASTSTAPPPHPGRGRRKNSARTKAPQPGGGAAHTAVEFALIARGHMAVYGTRPEHLATVSATIRNNGHVNPEAVYFGRGPFI